MKAIILFLVLGSSFLVAQNTEKVSRKSGDASLRDFDGVKLEMVFVKSGSFQMGTPADDMKRYGDEFDHRVTLTKDFYIGKFEVTQELYKKVIGKNPSMFKGDNLPVEQVDWYEAIIFCNKLSELDNRESVYTIDKTRIDPNNKFELDKKKWIVIANEEANGYRLPSEAQWEYAAKGGEKSEGFKFSGSNSVEEVAWSALNSGGKTHPVGGKKPNELGIYDMSGNVYEWGYYWNRPYGKEDAVDPVGNISGEERVIRGGSFNDFPMDMRSATRCADNPVSQHDILGFRVIHY